MRIKIAEIHFKDQKIEDYAIEKVAKLEKFHPGVKLVTIRLTLEKNHRTQNHTSFCELEFDMVGRDFVIKDSERQIDKAIDKAVERAKRSLVRHKEKEVSKKHREATKVKRQIRN